MEYNGDLHTTVDATNLQKEQSDFGISKIVDCKVDEHGQQLYKVEWQPTWEPWENLATCQHLINEFWSLVNSAKAKENVAQEQKQRLLLLQQGGVVKSEESYRLSDNTMSAVEGLIERTKSTPQLLSPGTTLMGSLAPKIEKTNTKEELRDTSSNDSTSNLKPMKANTSSMTDDFHNPYVRIAYLCKICGKEQSKKFKFDWKRHYNTHGTVPKPHRCEVCGKDFAQKGLLNKHFKTHNNSNGGGGNVANSSVSNINVPMGYGNVSVKQDVKDWHGKVESGAIFLD